MEEVKAFNNKFKCLECQNEILVDSQKVVGDIVECPFCGIEYEISGKDDAGIILQLIEEEK